MWNIRGHEIELGGGPYESDWGDPCVMVHCVQCPDGSTDGWNLWSDPDETGAAIRPEIGVRFVARHLRTSGVDIATQVEEAAIFMGQLQNEVETALQVLTESVNDTSA